LTCPGKSDRIDATVAPGIPALGAGLRGALWLVLVAITATIAVSNAFSLSNVFYTRDLASYFWPHHLWLRRTVWAGSLPLWAPGAGLGYATIADPNLQLLFPLTLPLRLLLPDVPGFNLMVALPVPLAATGAWFFLRRHFTCAAAALGALVFALSGPVLSSLSSPNFSASVALIPWVLWALDRLVAEPSVGRGAALAVTIALELLGGEPLTLAIVGVMSLAYAALMVRDAGGTWSRAARLALVVAGWQAVGLLLASAQSLPLLDAARRSPRATAALVDGWSVHPLALLEAVMPALFGGPVDAVSAWSPWLFPMNGGREPFLGSLYVGAGSLALALLGALESPRRGWIRFWAAVLLVALVLALGYFTPVYPWLRSTVPLLRSFRFPAKFTVFAVVALGCLVAAGWDALGAGRAEAARARRLLAISFAASAAGLGVLALGMTEGMPGATASALGRLAAGLGVPDPAAAAGYLARAIAAAAPQLVAIGGAAALCIWLVGAGSRAAPVARPLLFLAIVLNLLEANASLNPTMAASSVGEPMWFAAARAHPESRVYSAQPGILPISDPELPATFAADADMPAPAVTAVYVATLGAFPMAWGLESALAPDLTKLRPVTYTALLERFAASDRDARHRFLRRVGARYLLVREPPPDAGRPVARLEGIVTMALYEDPAPAARAILVPSARVVASVEARIAALFADEFAMSDEVLLGVPPPPASGTPGPGAAPAAAILEDQPTLVRVTAAVPEGGGYAVLLDSYDPNWVVEVDGRRAPLLEADGLFRAVRLAPGHHEVVFRYHSRPLLIGLVVSLATALGLAFWCARAQLAVGAPGRAMGAAPGSAHRRSTP
jgi:hypothetical protein